MNSPDDIKKQVRNWWDSSPCCGNIASAPVGTMEFFEQVDAYKDKYEAFTNKIADYGRWKDKRILEIGCGLGKDFSRFVSAGANATAIDMSLRSLELTAKRLKIFGLNGNLVVADAENLPFKENVFDLIFSWGVLHHTPGTQKAVDEIYRCLIGQTGKAIIMLYNKRSLKNAWFNIEYLFRPEKDRLLAAFTDGTGNPLSKVYSRREAFNMLSKFKNIRIQAYESKDGVFIKVFNFLKWLERYFGWFMVITAEK